jgi:peroxiredoxin
MAASRVPKLLREGSRSPDFRLSRLGGGEVALPDLLPNGPILLAFFKISCPVCQFTFPFLERLHTAGTLPVYGISQNDEEDTGEFNHRFGITFPTLLDPEEDRFPVSNAFGISSVPTLFLIERDGTVSRAIEGWQKKAVTWLAGTAGASLFRPGEFVPEMKAG